MLKNLHHANLLVASPKEAEVYLRQLCVDLGLTLANNPDFFAFKAETFGIEEARELRSLAARKTVSSGTNGKRIFFISPMNLTLEAQNALLKTFEEPFLDTYFFLVTREEKTIVPTLRSRMQKMTVPKGDKTIASDAKEFLALSTKDRLMFAKDFVDQEKNLAVFLDNLLELQKKSRLLVGKEKEEKKSIEKIYKLRLLASTPTPATRLIIEHLSLVL